MKRYFTFISLFCVCFCLYAQNLIVKSINLRPQDARAASLARTDKNGKKCAIVRVGVVGVDDLVFPDAVGNVEHSFSEYVVYVSEGLKTLQYNNKAGKRLGSVVFDDYDIEINSLASYDVIFESENHLRSAIFSLYPKDARLIFNGKRVDVNEDGMAMINMPVGDYSYQISANGFESQSGTVSLIEDNISTLTNVNLQEILYPVKIQVNTEDATVFIDDVPYVKNALNNLQLSGGKHSVRVTATYFEDDERTIDVKNGMDPISFVLKANKQEIVKHSEERSRTKVNIRNAFYVMGGVEYFLPEKDIDTHLVGPKLDISYVAHFGGIFAFRTGLGVSLLFTSYSNDFGGKELLQDSLMHIGADIPLQVGLSIPFGKYNRHLFSVFAGGYARGLFLIKGKDEAEEYRKILSDDHFELEKNNYDFGLRASFKLDISQFTIGADITKSLNGFGYSGAVILGIKFYTTEKKKQ